jgi:hypothetical protein
MAKAVGTPEQWNFNLWRESCHTGLWYIVVVFLSDLYLGYRDGARCLCQTFQHELKESYYRVRCNLLVHLSTRWAIQQQLKRAKGGLWGGARRGWFRRKGLGSPWAWRSGALNAWEISVRRKGKGNRLWTYISAETFMLHFVSSRITCFLFTVRYTFPNAA